MFEYGNRKNFNLDINGKRIENVGEKLGRMIDRLSGGNTNFGDTGKKIDEKTKDWTLTINNHDDNEHNI